MLKSLFPLALAFSMVHATSVPVHLTVSKKNGDAHAGETLVLKSEESSTNVELDNHGQALVRLNSGHHYQVWYKNFMGDVEECRQCQAINLPADISPDAEGDFKFWYESNNVRLDIKFDLAKASLKKDHATLDALNKVAKFLRENTSYVVQIAGHTDDQGSETYNLKLSLERAESTRNYLISQGVSPSQLTAKGYGFSSPLIAGTSPAAREANRRTEAVLISQ